MAGELAGSQPLELSLRLGPTFSQSADLETLLVAQTTTGSPDYHRWLTPEQFQERFGWKPEERQTLVDWLAIQGLTLRPEVSTASRLTFTATAFQATHAFRVRLHQVLLNDGRVAFANNTDASLPASFAKRMLSVSGLDNLPEATAGRLVVPSASASDAAAFSAATSSAGERAAPVLQTTSQLLNSLEDAISANASPILTLDSRLCAQVTSTAQHAAFHLALEQAQAQGITVLAAGQCTLSENQAVGAAFPQDLAEVSAVVIAATSRSPSFEGEPRPIWQAASGLPSDGLRHAPDFAVRSLTPLQNAVLTLVQQTGNRLGNLSPTLYSMQKSPGLLERETDGQDWNQETGLGILNVDALLRLYPRGSITTTTALQSTSYAVGYGDSFTLTANVVPSSYGATSPTGTVTFTSSTQGVLGSATVTSGGAAILTPDVLPVGTYTVTATYSGDGSYGGSASTSKVVITVSIVNAKLSATVAPQNNVPYGATATVTATVSLPGANATPTGLVSAQIQGITGALFTATLSPNPGVNTATANIIVAVPPQGTYTLQVNCQGNTNFQCQTPMNLPFTTIKGYTNTAVSVLPAAPQAGQPISLTASITNAGNGTGTYTFNGSVSFYDSGKLVATAPVATNQATAVVTLSGNRTHNITALYTGDTNWSTSTSSAVAVSPNILPDALTISSNVPSGVSLAGTNIVFSATATSTVTYGVGPTGTITFFDTFNGAVVQLGNPTVLVGNGPTAGVATFSTTGLQPGTHNIYAQYSGDSNYATSTSGVLTLALSDFGLTMTPSSLTLAQGKSQQVGVLVTASAGYSGTISLGCVPPASSEATCSFAPSSVSAGSTATLTITTTAPSVARLGPVRGPKGWWPAASGATLAAAILCLLPRRSRRLPVLLPLLLASMGSFSMLGCGLGVLGNTASQTVSSGSTASTSSGGSSSTGNAGSPLGTQNFTITAAGTDGVNVVRHTLQYQVTIQ